MCPSFDTYSWCKNQLLLDIFVAMASSKFDQKDASLITLYQDEIFFSFGGTYGREDNSFVLPMERDIAFS